MRSLPSVPGSKQKHASTRAQLPRPHTLHLHKTNICSQNQFDTDLYWRKIISILTISLSLDFHSCAGYGFVQPLSSRASPYKNIGLLNHIRYLKTWNSDIIFFFLYKIGSKNMREQVLIITLAWSRNLNNLFENQFFSNFQMSPYIQLYCLSVFIMI